MPKNLINTDTKFDPNSERLKAANTELEDFYEKEKPIYKAEKDLVEAVNLSIALGRPLLLQGEPGCGKTTLAKLVAYQLGLPLERFDVKSTSKARDVLYLYDAVSRLYDAQLADKKEFDINSYLEFTALGKAIKNTHNSIRSVVLIDEIDKANFDFPNDLLLELDRYKFTVPENKNKEYKIKDEKLRPIVIITDNEDKPLPAPFLRRCIFYHMKFPENKELIEEILQMHDIDDKELNIRAIEIILHLRKLDLNKKPGLSELIDWVKFLKFVNMPKEELFSLPYIGALLKNKEDQEKARVIK